MRNLSKKAKTIIAGAAIAGLASTGVAYAYWTSTGNGSGTATTGTSTQVTVNQASLTTTTLSPGTAIDLSGTFDNNLAGAVPVTITHVTATIDPFGSTAAYPTKPPCTQDDYTITGTGTASGVIPVGAAQGTWNGLHLNMVLGAGNQDNCKGFAVPITYNAN